MTATRWGGISRNATRASNGSGALAGVTMINAAGMAGGVQPGLGSRHSVGPATSLLAAKKTRTVVVRVEVFLPRDIRSLTPACYALVTSSLFKDLVSLRPVNSGMRDTFFSAAIHSLIRIGNSSAGVATADLQFTLGASEGFSPHAAGVPCRANKFHSGCIRLPC